MIANQRSRPLVKPVAAPFATLVDTLLAEQARTTTAVEAFARWQDRQKSHGADPGGSRTDAFRSLIPLTRPGPGEQYAFEVNLAQCTGCKACVAACHTLNGLDADESWRDAGWVTAPAPGGAAASIDQTITTACHHCEDPACAHGCPVLAYEKEATTGIVRHLDDQCIGCSYCILKCPYDAPKFNPRLGIVRKCDMCHQRLQADEAPACVQACPTEAITIRIVNRDRPVASGERLVPGAFPSAYTRPTTRYVGGTWSASTTTRPQAERPGEPPIPREEASHPPLSVMLVLTQMAAGSFVWAAARNGGGPESSGQGPLLTTAALACHAGVAASVLHLGQPLKAWRIFLGWRRSWLSREALVLGAFAMAAAASALTVWPAWASPAADWMPTVAAVLGIAGVAASGMVYVDTRRPFWSPGLVAVKFGGTTALLGTALTAAVWAWQADAAAPVAAAAAVGLRWALASWEWCVGCRARSRPSCPWHASAMIQKHRQRGLNRLRTGLFWMSGVLLPAGALTVPGLAPVLLTASLLATTISQLIERHQFFTAGAAPRMPGLA